MSSAKEIRVEPISSQDAKRIVIQNHYSGKVDPRSQLHFGVFLNGRCGGAMSLGPPIDKRKALPLVKDTPWNGMLDLHRLAFADWLPRNGESRAISVMMMLIRKHYPHIEWVQSYADATQCGDGTIYRAAGFLLVQIKENMSMWRMPDGEVHCKIVFEPGFSPNHGPENVKVRYGKQGPETAGRFLRRIGATCLKGFQLRYVYFTNPAARERLTLPVLPYSAIAEAGAKMYRGKMCAGSIETDVSPHQGEEGGATPTPALQSSSSTLC